VVMRFERILTGAATVSALDYVIILGLPRRPASPRQLR
jgi:hypothetical protein